MRAPYSADVLGALFFALTSSWGALAKAQADEPPMPPSVDEAATADEAPPADPYAGGDTSSPPFTNSAGAGASATTRSGPAPTVVEPPVAAESATAAASAPASDTDADKQDAYERWFRKSALGEQNTLSGSTGLMRVRVAGSGPAGSFRVAIASGYFGQTGFLCTPSTVCPDPVTGAALPVDDAQRARVVGTLSATPWSFLEAFVGLNNTVSTNSNGSPTRTLQATGDLNLGVKVFVPQKPDRVFYFGGETELSLLTGTGGPGFDSGATGFALRALGTLDFTNRFDEERRFPLRAHLNLGYRFDNSANLVAEFESQPYPQGNGGPISRIQRYGLHVSRVDAFEIGMGVDFPTRWVRPFLEWTIDVPVNRQGYVCSVQGAAVRGDLCLGAAAAINTSPNRFSLGARVYPWQASGLALTGALDIGAGATNIFLEEVTPETPYMLWFALGYAVDVAPIPPKPVEVAVATPTELELRRYIVGQVVNQADGREIPSAILRYEGEAYTGMVADTHGRFTSADLPPGHYAFLLAAEEYREGRCEIDVPETATGAAPQPGSSWEPAETGAPVNPYTEEGEPSSTPPASSQRPGEAAITGDGLMEIPVVCKMKELPRVADVVGLVLDAANGATIADANVTVTDKLNRSLTLAADAQGSLLFQNVPFGISHLTAAAPGYMTTVMPINLDSRKRLEVHIVLNKRPKKATIEVGPSELKLAQPILFVENSAEVAADTMIVVEELATILKEQPKVKLVEIQVHSDDGGAASYARTLTQDRADQLRKLLIEMGVPENRLVAKGFGPDQPLTPNVSDAAREQN
ncbi:MAG TPA: OmpA family protein, partial [Polyangiaceae bacterium]|nr:OmpA family protein [Polyangiaceae bacterium]